MPLIYQSNNKLNSLQAKIIKVERKHIKDAYFATRKEEPVYEGTPSTHTVVSGDTLSKIANKNSITVAKLKADNELTSDLITIGQQLTLSKATKKGDKISFTKVKEAKVGEEIYIIVKTENANELKLKINIKQGIEDGVAKIDDAIILQQDDKDTDCVKVTVGNYCNEQGITNKDDFKDWAIAKVILQPKNTDKQKEWSDNLECLQDKKSKVYLLVDAHSDNEYPITYHGRNPYDEGKPDHETCPNRWLDIDGKWFELGKKTCYCDRDLTEEEVKDIIDKEKLFYHKKCPLPQNEKTYKEFTKQLNATFKKYSINTCLRKAHFIAQTEAESDHYKTTIEYANGWDYDHSTHKDDYDKYKLYLSDKKKYKKNNTKEIKRSYFRYKECIKHGHNVNGYGPKYKGKGLIQLTWKDTYEKYFNYLGKKEFISNPEKVAESLKYSFDSAGWYWIKGSVWGDMNTKADMDDLIAVSIGINGGLNGYAHRKKNLKSILEKMKIKDSCANLKEKKIGIYKYETSSIRNTKFGKKKKDKIKAYDD